MLKTLLSAETVMLNIEAADWMDAVYKGAEPLLQKGTIEKCYVDAIIHKVKTLGPYIVIAPGIAIPHSRPEDGVNELSMSLITLKNPVHFGSASNDPVKLVITFAAADHDLHLSVLQQLMELLSNPGHIDVILNSGSKEKILEMIRNLA